MNVVLGAAWCFAASGILLGIAALVVFRQPLLALRVTLELLTAAGLLRLSVDSSWAAIAVTAVLIVIRRTITRSLMADLSAPPWRSA
ncbi:hypothetical protein [Mycolicibacterium iranicum]|uniref:DUF1622 domain-containing protein n=1 Tax=Mycolicibacterium iranicum TaxID=912594 RepID=A0A1X1WCM6_MYCIR|nr:hypothetical protein [Mycolicibacterium iranicum]ORV84252.1 hypothetical protein AWC12_22485 [Mycolicibacterium iranicum]